MYQPTGARDQIPNTIVSPVEQELQALGGFSTLHRARMPRLHRGKVNRKLETLGRRGDLELHKPRRSTCGGGVVREG
ncbi:hypothetical protein EI94DRAFT_1740353 [Lactarius quietus]|nr:hypothetical protein EI94DRAFT_1740353 [Lactarius quietus]